ncbi:MAG: hypothetical protein C0621_05480, partial [Desulfuromonas sp.]
LFLLLTTLVVPAAWAGLSAAEPVEIHNQATGLFYWQPASGTPAKAADPALPDTPVSVVSNTVSAITELPLVLDYVDPTFDHIISKARLGNSLFIEADAPGCNSQGLTVETRLIVITSRLTGDREEYTLTETDANSGVFHNIGVDIPTRNGDENPILSGNGILETVREDTLTASIDGCGTTTIVETIIYIDPAGIVFDSRNNLPISGATVTLIDVTGQGNGQPDSAGVACSAGIPGAPAKVLSADALSIVPNTLITGGDGKYEFPTVCPSTYRLEVTPPQGATFPSIVLPAELPVGRRIDSAGSYGESFDVNLQTGAVFIDIPLDRPFSGFFLKKEVSRDKAEIAETIRYTLTVKNQSEELLTGATIHDRLPFGFAYINGSSTLNGTNLADPAGIPGRDLVFTLPDLPVGGEHRLSYRTRIRPGALQGDGVNTAQAFADGDLNSNRAQAKVEVEPGVFDDRAFVTGKVFVDCSRNRLQDSEDIGIPGVRLFLEDGTWVITDSEGKYSFYGLDPRTHVLKLDPLTLPAEAQLLTLDNRFAGDAASRFIDLKRGELHRADFAEGSCSDEIMAEVIARREKGEVFVAETVRAAKRELSNVTTTPLNRDESTTTGVIDNLQIPTFPSPGSTSTLPAKSAPLASAVVPLIPLDTLLEGADTTADFLDLNDGDTLPFAQVQVRVKGPVAGSLSLYLNNEEVDPRRIGTRITDSARGLQALEYIGLDLAPGLNRLTLFYHDQFGNQRQRNNLTLIAPAALARLAVTFPSGDAVADGQTPVTVRVALFDANNVPVTVRTQLTLETTLGHWQEEDLNPAEAGVQVFVEGGSHEFLLLPPQEPGRARLRLDGGVIRQEVALEFLPELRPLVASGLLEGMINLRRLGKGAILDASSDDGFEEELDNLADGRFAAGGRAALFLKGKVLGDTLLTLAYDSAKQTHDRLFRDIEPDRFYPVYGDSSVRGYDAQSSGRLYVRLDRGSDSLLLGDFNSRSLNENRKLTQYSRSLNGLKGHVETPLGSVTAFASPQSSRQVVEEIAGAGVSGPYYISAQDRVENSEQVTLVVRDRNHPAQILSESAMTRFSDYEIDSLSGRLLFKSPVATYDAELNPIFIRVTCEVKDGDDPFWVGGVEGESDILPGLEVGGVAVIDDDPFDRYALLGANGALKLGEQTTLHGEWGISRSESAGEGDAQRFELRHTSTTLEGRLYAQRAGKDFVNPSALLPTQRQELGGEGSYRLNSRLRLLGEGVLTRDLTTGGERHGLLLGAEYRLPNEIIVEGGLRYAREGDAATTSANGTTPNSYTGLRGKVSAQAPFLPTLALSAEVEQGLENAEERSASLGGDYRFTGGGRLYARHHFVSSLSGEFALNDTQERQVTQIGIESPTLPGGTLFSEYRLRDALGGEESEASIGLRNQFTLRPGLSLNTTLERITALSGANHNDSTAVTAGLSYTASERWKGSLRGELRNGSDTDSQLASATAAIKATRDLTLLARQLSSTIKTAGSSRKSQHRLQLGGAWRPVDHNRLDALWRYEYKTEKETDLVAPAQEERRVHIISLHGNLKVRRDLTLNGRLALKLAEEKIDNQRDDDAAELIALRGIYDLSERWDIGLQTSLLTSGDGDALRYGVGAEVGYLLAANLWLAGGYNIFGYHDRDLSGADFTNPGVYVRLRFKFDETLFAASDPRQNKTLAPK